MVPLRAFYIVQKPVVPGNRCMFPEDNGMSFAEVSCGANAIIQAAVHGVSISGGTLYSTTFPAYYAPKCLLMLE